MRYAAVLTFFLVASLPFAGMLFDSSQGDLLLSGGDESLIIVSPHNREVKQEYTRAFHDWMLARSNRSVGIRWLDVGGTSKVLKDLESRFAANPEAPGVDLLFGGGLDPYVHSAENGWLAVVEVPEAILGAIPPHCAGMPTYDQKRRWFGVALSGFGIIYSTSLLERLSLPAPKEWEDLAGPGYFSWIGSGDPRSSGSVHMCYEIILQAYGFEKGWGIITRLCANVRNFGESGGTAPREVMSGDVAAGMVIDQYAQRAIAALEKDYERVTPMTKTGKPLGFVLPRGATVINPDAIAMLKGAPHSELARLFVHFALSQEGQRILFQPKGKHGQLRRLHRMPVLKALYQDQDAPSANPYVFEGGFDYDDKKGGRRWRVLNDLIGRWCIDTHRDLQRAWKAVIDAGLPEELVRKLCAPPLSEQELEQLGREWKEPRRRLATMDEWAKRARKRYRSIESEANTIAKP